MSSKAQAAKEKGNTSFKSGDFPSAIAHYTTAILEDQKDWTFPLNRAAAYLKLGKNEDAERDCTTVLSLNPGNVKALFRRGQARGSIDGDSKLEEAKKDFEEALRLEPKNDPVRTELEKVQGLLRSKKSRRTQPLDINISASGSSSEPSVPRRRVPIKIIRPDGSIVPSTSTTAKDSTAPIPNTSTKITVLPSPSASNIDASSHVPSSPSPSSSQTTPQPKTFQDAKRMREAKESQKPQVQPPQSGQVVQKGQSGQRIYAEALAGGARTSPVSGRVGGGIFRASGENKIFESRENKPKIEEVDVDQLRTNVTAQTKELSVTKENVKVTQPLSNKANREFSHTNMTLFDFDRKWQQLVSPEEKFEFLSTIKPNQLPVMFQTSLEPSLLTSICQTILDALENSSDRGIEMAGAEYMQAFTKVPRIRTVVLFLSQDEKEIIRAVLRRLEQSDEEIRGIAETCRATMKL
ncbi:hypothetical protein K435DRAFT_847653 [Dendrothele bispora CBS 962.96]|uniref:RNA polymerase II-associated protein 3 n=1 Tax=Dendrothele bispora (strain CBS 962.96) TaxID=1314807 RepID=A0A4S8MXB2_DENBC|nr:hypothetical protein K435DRAFT_847653 [Dendrothele bispora CBS 962.96]